MFLLTSALNRSRKRIVTTLHGRFAVFSMTCSLILTVSETSAEQVSNGYPRQHLLIEASELSETKNDKRVILDTRDKKKYDEGHIPSALWIDATAWGKAVTEDQDPHSWTKRFAELGINDDSELVIYDDQRLRSAARVWWILRLWGVERPRVLNGGWQAYLESGKTVDKGAVGTPKTGTAIAKRDGKVLATKDQLLSAFQAGTLGKAGPGQLQIIDTRSTTEYCGTAPSRSKRTGTIPGAKHLEWSDLLVPETSRLKTADEIKRLFVNAGIDVDQPAATFCQGGGRAAVMAFGLEVLGSPEARNYYSSWGEWGDDETAPIERPASYAREELLIEAVELKKLPSRPGSRRVLDARAKQQFEEGHLKDSIHVVAADWSKDFGDGRDTESWGRRLGQLGIGRDTEVIVYDNNAGQDAARIWWYLKYWGVCQARLVNGGWKAIQAAELPTETGNSRFPAESSFSSPPLAARKIDQAALVALHQAGRLGTDVADGVQLIDARSEKEFLGLQVAEGQRPGTIPGARHLEWSDLVEPTTGRFRPTPDVLQLLKDRGIDLNRPVVPFSNTRGRSASIAFPLELAGAVQTRIFETGIKSWGSDPNNPIVVPKP